MKDIICPKCGEKFSIDDSGYLDIVNQVRTEEFDKSVKQAVKDAVEKNSIVKEKEFAESLKTKELEIKDLENKLKNSKENLEQKTNEAKLQVEKEMLEKMAQKDIAYNELKSSLEKIQAEADLVKEKEINKIKSEYEETIKKKELDIKDIEEELERVKEHKLSLSTKAVGEDLEQYCKAEFEKLRAVAYRDAYFEKDNTIADGTKGDFVFRDFDNGIEYISIMFEMKNESDATETKHKNEDFFKKLDSDRKKKNCEYAILVSMLEQDNDFYNRGIAEICQYEKMFVVRPQNFMDIISLLRNMARSSLKDKRALVEKQRADIDLTNFTNNVHAIMEQSGVHYKNAVNQHEDAIKEINNAIKKLEANT